MPDLDLSIEIAPAEQTVFTGAESAVDGRSGLVPAPEAGQDGLFLKGDGTWAQPAGGPAVAAQIGPGFFAMHITAEGRLTLTYDDADAPPPLSISNGHLIYTLEG